MLLKQDQITRKQREQRRKQYMDEWNKKMRKMVEYKIMEPVPGEKGNYQYTGEFIAHCYEFKKEMPLTKYEVEYIESHQEDICKDYAQSVIMRWVLLWIRCVKQLAPVR
jgi:hypothetical protein